MKRTASNKTEKLPVGLEILQIVHNHVVKM